MQRISEAEGTIKLSVRDLVEFILKSGDIDNRRSSSADKEAMQAGSRLHKKIQKKMGAHYQSEVSLKHQVSYDNFTIIVEGRADGIIRDMEGITIDEIKGVYFDLSNLEEPIFIHKAQAMCYGYIFGIQNNLTTINIQMTYGNLETEEIKRFHETKGMDELEDWFHDLIREYFKWANFEFTRRTKRKGTIRQMEFPFDYRSGQRDTAVAVYRTISRQKTLFVQAPTGIGKTIATIFPSVKAVGEGFGDKIFYLTAKTITRTVAEESFQLLRQKGLSFSTVTITAKDKLCLMETTDCNPESCPFAKGHYDRINEAVFDMVHEVEGINRETILQFAKQYEVCPFELCLDATNWVDGIICDYNYVFDPNVKLKRYFSDGIKGDYLFLVDEAHNLVPRAREMFSAEVYKEDFLVAKKRIKNHHGLLASKIEKCNKALLMMKRECDTHQILDSISHFVMLLSEMYEEMEKFMEENRTFEGRAEVLDFYLSVWSFLNIYERVDENYCIYTEHLDQEHFMLKLLCVNPAINLKDCLDKGNSTIFFSATFLPIQYYRKLLRDEEEDYGIYVDSPFEIKNRLLLVGRDVSSKYTRRGQAEYQKIVDYVISLSKAKTGNYIVFFPSYAFMEAVGRLLREKWEIFDLIEQDRNMNETVREEFLQEFEQPREKSLIALCVMGGIFSEGIDLTRDRLIGTIIVGTGLPMVGTEGNLLKDYFDKKGESGFDFAYQYPGMNKVLQSAGRVIRTSEDRGVILLLDDRFLRPDYQMLFPREWEDYKVITRNTIGGVLEDFWSSDLES